MTNLELKASVAELAEVRARAVRVGAVPVWVRVQTDTYFWVPQGGGGGGRLKLREFVMLSEEQGGAGGAGGGGGAGGELIGYRRADDPEVRASEYVVYPTADPETLKAALAGSLGVWLVVRKRRELLMYHNVRIHLDEVEGLGSFMEFEAVLGEDEAENVSRERLAMLRRELGIEDARRVAGSYSDHLAARLEESGANRAKG